MASPIISLNERRRAPASKTDVALDGARSVPVPFRVDAEQDLSSILQDGGLDTQSRWIWLAQPTLLTAARNTIKLLSLAWPDPEEPAKSACATAILQAVRNVLGDHQEGERSRDVFVGHFLEGLVDVTTRAVAGTVVYGGHLGRAMEQYNHDRWDFVDWAHGGRFDAVYFMLRKSPVRATEKQGVETVVVSKIAANSIDVGCYRRHG